MDKIEFSKQFEQHKTKLYGFAMKLTRYDEDAKDLSTIQTHESQSGDLNRRQIL